MHIGRTALGALLAVSGLCSAPARAQDAAQTAAGRATSDWYGWYRYNFDENVRWMQSRELASANDIAAGREVPAARVGVFADFGVWHLGARSIVDALEREDVRCQVLFRTKINPTRLAALDVVILPGGWAPYQLSVLDKSAQAALKEFVHNGGRCVGVCAGAYLVSRTVRWEGAEYRYPLELFDGTANGPVPGLAAWPQAGPVRLAPTAAGIAQGLQVIEGRDVYYGGGSSFVGGTSIATLARYPNGSPAVVSCPVGKGEVVLSGVHFERPAPSAGGDDAPPPEIAGKVLKSLVSGARQPASLAIAPATK